MDDECMEGNGLPLKGVGEGQVYTPVDPQL